MSNSVKYLLLGGGYTLSRLASQLEPREFVITSTSADKISQYNALGYNAEIFDLKKDSQNSQIFSRYPNLEILIDSIPPLDVANTDLNLFAAKLNNTSLKRVIYLSTTGVFGIEDGSWVDEDTLTKPNNPRSQARLNAENIYFDSGLQTTACRIAAIYGPSRGMAQTLKAGRYRMLENGERWSNRIHVDDIVECLKAVLRHSIDGTMPKILCLSDNYPDQIKNVVDFYCKKFNLRFPEVIKFEEAEKLDMHSLRSNQRVRNSKLKEFLGKDLKYPSYKEGSATEIISF